MADTPVVGLVQQKGRTVINPGRLYLRLSNSFLHAAWTRRGRVVCSTCHRIPEGAIDRLWKGADEVLTPMLERVVEELRVPARSPTVVLYSGPDSVLELFSLPVQGDDALQAAELALADIARFSLHAHPSRITRLSLGKPDPMTAHLVAAADRNETLEALSRWIESAGLRISALIPDRFGDLLTVASAFNHADRSGAVVSLSIGRGASALIGGVDGKLAFARVIDLGIERLAESVARALREIKPEDADASLPLEAGEDTLFEHGIPIGGPGVKQVADRVGVNYLPHLQPVLQRLVVEFKQTIRFGMPDAVNTRILLSGLAARIPGLAEILANQLELDVDAVKGPVGEDLSHAGRTAIPVLARGSVRIPGLLPRRLEDATETRSLGRVVFAGTIFAGLLLGGDALMTKASIDRVQTALADARPATQRMHTHLVAEEQAIALASRVHAAEKELQSQLGERSSWAGLLSELSRCSTEEVRIIEVRGRHEGSTTVVTLEGVAGGQGAGGDDPIGAYIRTLRDSPVIASVKVGTTRRTEIEGRPATRFSVELSLVGMPTLASAQSGGER